MWAHAALCQQRKLELYKAMVEAKLLYGLSSLWFCKAERRRLDGFQNRCLRSIFSIQPAFISRISNKTVLQTSGQPRLSSILLRRQLLIFGKVARQHPATPSRQSTFTRDSLQPLVEHFIRKIGRPRANWAREVLTEAEIMAGGHTALETLLQDASPSAVAHWKRLVSALSSDRV